MSPISAFFICLALFIITEFFILPRLQTMENTERTGKVTARAAVTGAAKTIWTISLACMIAFGSLVLYTWVRIHLFSQPTEDGIQEMTMLAHIWGERFKAWKDYYGYAFMVFCLLVLGYIGIKGKWENAQERIKRSLQKQYNELMEQAKSGNLHVLEPTNEMKLILKKIDDLHSRRKSVLSSYNMDGTGRSADELGIIDEQLTKASATLLHLDLVRRLTVELGPEPDAPRPTTFLGKIALFFSSRSMFATLKMGKRIAGIVVLVLFFLMLVGWQSSSIEEQTKKRAAVLFDLRIHKNAEQARMSLERENPEVAKALHSDEDDNENNIAIVSVPNDVQSGIKTASRHLSILISKSTYMGNAYEEGASAQSTVIRERILQKYTEAAKKGSKTSNLKVSSYKSAGNVKSHISYINSKLDKTFSGNAEKLSSIIEKKLTNAAKVDPKFANFLKGFTEPASGRSVAHAFAGDLVGEFISESYGEASKRIISDSATKKLTSKILEKSIKSGATRYVEVTLDRFAKAGLEGHSPNQAIESALAKDATKILTPLEIESFESISKKGIDSSLKKFNYAHRNTPPRLITESPKMKIREENGAKLLKSLNSNATLKGSRYRLENSHADALAQYEDFFPPSKGYERKTTRGKLLKQVQLSNAALKPKYSAKLFRASGRFGMLRGFARVGGVLIGHTDYGRSNLDFVDFKWEELPENRVRFNFIHRNGSIIKSTSFHRSMVPVALAYAADGRPLAVTMITAAPLSVLKILVHPVLEDTAIGCRLVKFDRLVDTITGPMSGDISAAIKRNLATRHVKEEVELYRFAQLARLSDKKVLEKLPNELKNYVRNENERLMSNPMTSHTLDSILSKDTFVIEKGKSLILDKPDFFDKYLVSTIQTCIPKAIAKKEIKLKKIAFSDCVQNNHTDEVLSAINNDDEYSLKRIFSPAPEYQIWSGIREKQFSLDENLDFLKDLQPFNYIIQISFTTPPSSASKDEADAFIGDTNPWTFPSISTDIQMAVEQSIAKDKKLKIQFNEVREFLLLQRFFRIALRGDFGPDFPLEKLEFLADKWSIVIDKTPRWNSWQANADIKAALTISILLKQTENANSKPLLSIHNSLITCRDALLSPSRHPNDPMPKACDLQKFNEKLEEFCPRTQQISLSLKNKPACLLKYGLYSLQESFALRQLRINFGLHEEHNVNDNNCKPL